MKVLYFSNDTVRDPAPRWGVELIRAGPSLPNFSIEERVVTLNLPGGVVDVEQTIARLPSEQVPDAVLYRPATALQLKDFQRLTIPNAVICNEWPAGSLDHMRRFSRVILAGSPAGAHELSAAGFTNIFWHPGLLLGFGDEQARQAMQAQRADRLAISTCLDKTPAEFVDAISKLFSARCSLEIQDPLVVDPLRLYGECLGGLSFGSARAFTDDQLKILATGAVLFSDSLLNGSGQTGWTAGRQFIAYRNSTDLANRVRAIFDDSDNARVIGDEGRKWFLTHCSELPRGDAFRRIVFDGIKSAAFEVGRMAATVQIARVVNRTTVADDVRDIRAMIHRGDLSGALGFTQKMSADRPQQHQLLAEIALEASNPALCGKALARARALAPQDSQLHIMQELNGRGMLKPVGASRIVEEGWRAFERREYAAAHSAATRAVMVRPHFAAAEHLMGLALLHLAQTGSEADAAYHYGQALKQLNAAVGSSPGTGQYWSDLAKASRQAGLLIESIDAHQRAFALGEEGDVAAAIFGETLLAHGECERACDILRAAVARSPHNDLLNFLLGHATKQLGRLPEALNLHCKALGRTTSVKKPGPGKRRIVFLAQHPPMWTNLQSVYAAFACDETWAVVVVALPYLIPTFQGKYDESNAVFDFLSEKGVPYVRWDEFKLELDFADVLFVENPYDYTRPMGWKIPDLVKLVPRLAYVPYGIEIGGGKKNNTMVMNMTLQQIAWMVFARSERQRQAYGRHCVSGNAHVVVTGHPRMDALRELSGVRDEKLDAQVAGRKAVLWNPHLDARLDGTRFGRGFSTFLGWRFFMLEEFARRPDLVLIIRPHPQLFSMLHAHGVQTQAQIDSYLARCAEMPNVIIDRRQSYLPVFAATHAIMSDASSFVLEYAVTGKPVLYLRNPCSPGLDLDGEFVAKYCQSAETEREICRFLDDVSQGADPGRETRRSAITEYMYDPPGNVGDAVKEAVANRLMMECAPLRSRHECELVTS